MIFAFVKIPLFLTTLISYILISLVVECIVRNENTRLKWLAKITSIGSTIALSILGITVTVNNRPTGENALRKVLVISNHLSYLDIFIISSLFPSLYITSVEVQHMFFLGLMARLGGSIFIERRSKTLLLNEIDRISDILKKGYTITLFPEGTSSNGDKVLPFKGALFKTAEKAAVPIQPICIKYTEINKKQITAKNRDYVFYYGDLEFFPHLLKLFFVRSTKVNLTFLEQQTNLQVDRKNLVDNVFAAISECYNCGV
jgi:1-acyl-sn-glycerol-3-phosphate acyltransferase